MKELFYLSHEQIARIKRYFPRSHGIPRVDDRRVVSGIIYVIKHGLQWKDARASMDHTKLSTIVLSAGADWVSLTGFLRSLLNKTAPQHA